MFSDTRGRILTNDPDPESPEAPAPSYTIPQTPEKRPEGLQKIVKLLKLAMLGGIWACFSSLGHGFARHFVEMKPTDALHLPI